jgi:hypothetical protein
MMPKTFPSPHIVKLRIYRLKFLAEWKEYDKEWRLWVMVRSGPTIDLHNS